MTEEFSRSALLLGEAAMERLQKAHVAVFGVGGVGAACCEALARGGVGRLSLFDPDTVSVSNINRQLEALHSTVGRNKAEVMRERIADINPHAQITAYPVFYGADNAALYPLEQFDYIADCIDTVSSKLLLIVSAYEKNVPILSALGAGNKMDPFRLRAADIGETSVCPLARVMRRELRKRGVQRHAVIFSTEPPMEPTERIAENGRHLPGSLSFVPPVMGMMMAGEIIKSIAGIEPGTKGDVL